MARGRLSRNTLSRGPAHYAEPGLFTEHVEKKC